MAVGEEAEACWKLAGAQVAGASAAPGGLCHGRQKPCGQQHHQHPRILAGGLKHEHDDEQCPMKVSSASL